MIYFGVFVILFTIRNLSELFLKTKKQQQQQKKRGSLSLSILISSYFFSGLSVAYFLFTEGSVRQVLYLCGIFLFLFGYIGRIKSLKDLGENYSQYIDCVTGGYLVITGIYSIVRHPLYFFYIIEMTGFLTIKYNYISLISLIIVIVTIIYRIKLEESLLSETYKEEFEKYRHRTKILIPFIY